MGRSGLLDDEYDEDTHLALQNARQCFLDWDPEEMQTDAAALQGNLGSLAQRKVGCYVQPLANGDPTLVKREVDTGTAARQWPRVLM